MLVASGTYEEQIGRYVSVVLIGDSVNRPVIDPRGAPSWSSYNDAMYLGSAAAPLVVAHLVVKAGGVYLDAHDVTARDLDIEGQSGTNTYAGLEVYTENLTPAPPARGGPMRSGAPVALGNVLVDGVTVTGDSLPQRHRRGPRRHGDHPQQRRHARDRGTVHCTASSLPYGGIVVVQASVSVVQNDDVVNPACQGIGVFDQPASYVLNDVGRATISRNRVSRGRRGSASASARGWSRSTTTRCVARFRARTSAATRFRASRSRAARWWRTR